MPNQNKTPIELGRTIYDSLEDHPHRLLATLKLQDILRAKLAGLKLVQPIHIRSEVVKPAICKAPGYPVPKELFLNPPLFPRSGLCCLRSGV